MQWGLRLGGCRKSVYDTNHFLFSGIRHFFSELVPFFSELNKPALIFRTLTIFFRSIFRFLAYSTVRTPPPTGRIHPQILNPPPQNWFFYARAGPWAGSGSACHNSNNFQNSYQQFSEPLSLLSTIFRTLSNNFQNS